MLFTDDRNGWHLGARKFSFGSASSESIFDQDQAEPQTGKIPRLPSQFQDPKPIPKALKRDLPKS